MRASINVLMFLEIQSGIFLRNRNLFYNIALNFQRAVTTNILDLRIFHLKHLKIASYCCDISERVTIHWSPVIV